MRLAALLVLGCYLPAPLRTYPIPWEYQPDWARLERAMHFDTARPQAQPYFLVLFGAQGMGKGTALRRWAAQNSTRNYCHINVDAIVHSLPIYQQSVEDLMLEVDHTYLSHPVEDLAYWLALLNSTGARLDLLYQGMRDAVGNAMSDLWLDRAFLQRYNVAWETTGANLSATQRQLRTARAFNYTTKLLYPIASVPTAQRRAVQRFALTRAVANVGRIERTAENAQRNLRQLMDKGLMDEVILVDNTDDDMSTAALALVAHLETRETCGGRCVCPHLRHVLGCLEAEGDARRQAVLLTLLRTHCWACPA